MSSNPLIRIVAANPEAQSLVPKREHCVARSVRAIEPAAISRIAIPDLRLERIKEFLQASNLAPVLST